MGYTMKGFGGFGNSPLHQKKEIDFKKTNNYSNTDKIDFNKSNNYKATTTSEQDETAGAIEINDPEGMYGPGKGRRLFQLSEKELQDLGFSPEKIKEIKANKTAK